MIFNHIAYEAQLWFCVCVCVCVCVCMYQDHSNQNFLRWLYISNYSEILTWKIQHLIVSMIYIGESVSEISSWN